MPDRLRGATDLLGGTARATYLAEIWTEGEEEPGDGVRRVRRELGQGDLAMRRLDIPSQWYQPAVAQDFRAVGDVQRHGGGGLLPTEAQRDDN